jgi:hypothetical protein
VFLSGEIRSLWTGGGKPQHCKLSDNFSHRCSLLINFKFSERMIARLGTLFLVCTGEHKYLLSVFAFPHTNGAICRQSTLYSLAGN